MYIIKIVKNKLEALSKLNDIFDQKEKIQFIWVIIVALLMAFFQAAGIASILPFINMVMNPEIISENKWLSFFYFSFHFENQNNFIVFSGFVVLILLVIGNMVSAVSTWMKIHFVWRKNHSLSTALLRKYLSMPYSYFLDQNTANLGKNVLFEVHQLTNNFLMPLTKIITDFIVVIIILTLLIYVNPLVTLGASTILISSYLLVYLYFSSKLKTGGRKRLKENMKRFKSATEALSGIKDIKVLRAEKFFLERFISHSSIFSYLQAWYQVVGQVPRYIMETIAFGGIVGLLIFSVSSNVATEKIIPMVSFFAFAGYRLMPALQEVFNSMTTIKFNKAVLDKIHEDLTIDNIAGSKTWTSLNIEPLPFKNKISLQNIYFTYPGNGVAVLKNISMEININSSVALIGPTGSGKTTLVDLILGLFTPGRGIFSVDGVEINNDNLKNWQANLGYVPQQIYLSDDTVARNIAFGQTDEKINIGQVKKTAQMANLDKFIEEELPDGYDTFIGERGIRLSGGQRQRIGIARALYHNPQVLILDEATSSLDNQTEKEVLEAIDSVSRYKTMIIIAHRLTTVKNCDIVYKIEGGKIIAKGKFEDIVSQDSERI